MKNTKKRSRKLLMPGCLCILILSGCGTGKQAVITIDRIPYEKVLYQTIEVQKGDLEPELELRLQADGYETIPYAATNKELKLENVYVSVGDYVEKGDLLVSFQSEDIQKMLETHEQQLTQSQLLADHYTKLMQIDNTIDYSQDISQLQKDIHVEQLYIEEAKEKLSSYQLVAKESGTIVKMEESLVNGIFEPSSSLIIQSTSSGKYQTERPEGYEFQPGEIYTAELNGISYELQISEITEDTIFFKPISDMSSVRETDILVIKIKLPVLTDCIYVENKAVQEKNGNYFVYVMNEDGYREAVSVTVGDCVGTYRVITGGLSGGEKVTLK